MTGVIQHFVEDNTIPAAFTGLEVLASAVDNAIAPAFLARADSPAFADGSMLK